MATSRKQSSFSFLCIALFLSLCTCNNLVPQFAPKSRNLLPSSIYRTTGDATIKGIGDKALSTVTLRGPGASMTFDFGQQVAGVPSFELSDVVCSGGSCNSSGLPSLTCEDGCQGLGLAYTENKLFIGEKSDNSTFFSVSDGTVFLPLAQGHYEVPVKWGRGGFRYLTLSLGNTTKPDTKVSIKFTNLYYHAAPHVRPEDLSAYTGHFHSSVPFLNQVWDAGVHTVQLSTIGVNNSAQHTYLGQGGGWSEDAVAKNISSTEVFLTDGAKRDRNPWSGDIIVSLRSALVSQNYDNLRSARNSLQEIIILQDRNASSPTYGYFPYTGSPLGDLLITFGAGFGFSAFGSDTYNLYAIIGFCEYVLASGDTAWGKQYLPQMIDSLEAALHFVDNSTGLMNGTRTLDWARIGQGGQNTALNALLYRTLTLMHKVAPDLAINATQAAEWTSTAAKVKAAANKLLFDSKAGLFKDNSTASGATLHTQDGNVLAINFNLTTSPQQNAAISSGLAKRLNRTGAPAPELPGSIAPFIGSQELYAHFAAAEGTGNASNALNLIRTQWGFMLSTFSNSTTIEGYGADGSLVYGFYPGGEGFVSHTHAWSTGPTYSLLTELVGVKASKIDVKEGDGAWSFRPVVQGSGVKQVEGGFRTKDGVFEAEWESCGKCWKGTVTVPNGLNGTVYVPLSVAQGDDLKLKVDGQAVQVDKSGGAYMRIGNVAGGCHKIRLCW